MSEKRMFIILEELMERIDRHRGGMSRAEFVDYCSNCFLKEQTHNRQGHSDGRFEELRQRAIKIIENVPREGKSRPAKQCPQSPNSWNRVVVKSEDTPIQAKIAERGNAEAGTSFSWLWVPALLLFGFGDTLTSYLVFAAGGREANPFLAAVMHPFGGGMMSFVVVKAIILVALVLLSWYGLKKQGWIVPAALTILGSYLVVHNILSLGGLK